MDIYRYCTVKPEGMVSTFYYIANEDVKVGAQVLVPFGSEDRVVLGTVTKVNYFEEAEVPFPLNRMKTILEVLEPGEVEDALRNPVADPDHYTPEEAAQVEQDLAILDALLDEENYDAALNWACQHHDYLEHPEIMDRVVDVYETLIDMGNPVAALNLGSMYYNGTYLERDYKEAARLYQIAADAGEEEAICNLGYCYYYGRHQEVDYQKAYEYWTLGALLFQNPSCMYKLGDMYRNGYYVEQNEQHALHLYFVAMNRCMSDDYQGDAIADIDLRLGTAFLHSDVLEHDASNALFHLNRALTLFYQRRKVDPFVKGLIQSTKELIAEALQELDEEVI